MESVPPIRPELLAAKIEKIQNFQFPELLDQLAHDPRLAEVLWFLQFISQPANYPGGLTRFASDFIAAQSDRIGTVHMRKAKAKAGRYSAADAIAILHDLSDDAVRALFGSETWLIENEFLCSSKAEYWEDSPPKKSPLSRSQCNALLADRLTDKSAHKICVEAAKNHLVEYLKRVCEVAHVGFRNSKTESVSGHRYLDASIPEGSPWYFANVADALLAFMSDREASVRSRIADTEITRLVTRWIQKSRNTKQSVMITGNSRFGKTEAVKMNAEIAPGSCRLVQTPDSTAIGDLLREVARVLGLDVPLHSSVRELRERIEYVLRFSNLQLIFDESQMLLPGAFSRNTAPARLNWVRRSMMDRNIPVVFVCTPQSYLPAKNRFVRATGFAMEQFDERILKTVELPKELSEDDLLAVARIHFPNQREEYLQFIVDQAIATERNFVSDIGKIALLAKDNAQEAGRKLPILADIEAAMADVLPTPKQSAIAETAVSNNGAKLTRRRRCKASAKPLQPSRTSVETLPIPTREKRPEMISV